MKSNKRPLDYDVNNTHRIEIAHLQHFQQKQSVFYD